MKTRLRHAIVMFTALPLLLGAGVARGPDSAVVLRSVAPSLPLDVPGSHRDEPAVVRWMRGLGPDSTPVSVYVRLPGLPAFAAVRQAGLIDSPVRVSFARRHLATLESQHQSVAQQIEALGGTIEADLKRAVNVLQVRIPADRLDSLARLPDVTGLEIVPYYRRSLTTSVPFVGAPQLWGAAGANATGGGISVGIVDTGIDYTHADFGGPGDPQVYKDNDRTVVEPGTFPTAKVVGGYDFVGDDYTGENAANPDDDPLDCFREQEPYIAGGHGSHVAGIAAGTGVNLDGSAYEGTYDASFDPSSFGIAPGVAPEASLYALKVFGCDGGTTMVASALNWAIDPDGDGDFADRLDIVNMSLGGAYGFMSETEAELIRNLTDAGTLLVVAAGNDGDTFFVTGEPATYTEALSVAATTDEISYLSMTVESPPSVTGEVACVEGSFTKPLLDTGAITGALVPASPSKACSSFSNASELDGKIALIERGDCYFVDKIARAADAGALAAVVYNNVSDAPFSMGGDGSQSAIPGVMISQADGMEIRMASNVTVTLDPSNLVINAEDADQMAGFSSRGPRASDGLLKPDVAAPGVAIDSAGVGSGSQLRQNQGTSMACPMVAGAAALLREAHPERAPRDIKAMLMNTTAPLADGAGNPTPVSLAGAGRIRVDEAAARDVVVSATQPDGAVSVSFGALVTHEPVEKSQEITIKNLGTQDGSFEVSVDPTYALGGTEVSVSPSSLDLPAGDSSTVELTLRVTPGDLPIEAPDPHTPAELSLGGGQVYARHFVTEAAGHVEVSPTGADAGQTLRVPYHALVRAADRRAAAPARACATEQNQPIQIPMDGPTVHKEPVTSAFQLVTTHPANALAPPQERLADLLAVGVATNTATAESFADASVYFALAVAGEWMTPARGPLSVVAVALDTNEDDSEDYVVYAEPLAREFFADILAVTTYNLTTGQAVSRRFLNLLPRDQLNTEPFNNSVVVLPVSLGELNITEDDAGFRFRAFTQLNQFAQPDSTDWLDFDPTNPPIDTAVGGEDGVPFYPAPRPVSVQVHPDRFEGTTPQVLLLHHSNEQGMRHEIVDLSAVENAEPTDLALTGSWASTAEPGDTKTVALTVDNQGPHTAYDVTVTGTFAGAESLAAESTSGACVVGEDVLCSLGDVEAGDSVTVEVDVEVGTVPVDVVVSVQDGLSCETDTTNNEVSATIEVESAGDAGPPDSGGTDAGPSLAIDQFEPGGGCDCGLTGSRDRRGGAGTLALLAGLGWFMWGRRRRDCG